MKKVLITLVVALFVLSSLLGCKAPAATPTPTPEAPYFQGKTVTIILYGGAGGGTDIFARMLARHLPRFLPGNPRVVVRGMTAGGGIPALNYIYNEAKPDGLTLLGGSGTAWLLNLYRPKGVNFKLEEMPGLLAAAAGKAIAFHPDVAKEPIDLFTAEGLVFGDRSPSSSSGITMVVIGELLDLPIKYVWGYGGTGPAALAFLAGELTGFAGSALTYLGSYMQYEEAGEMKCLLQGGVFDAEGNVIRDPNLPDVPTGPELYEEFYGKPLSEQDLETYKGIVVSNQMFSRSIFFPPKTPANIIELWDKACRDMYKDAEFQVLYERVCAGQPWFLVSDAPDVWKGMCRPSDEVVKLAFEFAEKYGEVFD